MRLSEPTMKIWMKIDHNITRRGFSGLSALRLRHRRKWGQHYYIVLFSPLSPFHWLQNTWPWMTILRYIFTVSNSPLRSYFYILTIELVYITWPAEMRKSGPWSAEYLGSAERLRIFRRRYVVGTLTNKANISIKYYLVPDRLTTDSKVRDLEWPWTAIKFYFALVCLQLWSLRAWLSISKLGYS